MDYLFFQFMSIYYTGMILYLYIYKSKRSLPDVGRSKVRHFQILYNPSMSKNFYILNQKMCD